MRPDEFRGLLSAQPFQPFRIHLSNGLSYDIRHPEMALVERSIVWIYLNEPADLPTLAERRVFVVLLHIVYGEFVEPTSGPSTNGPPAWPRSMPGRSTSATTGSSCPTRFTVSGRNFWAPIPETSCTRQPCGRRRSDSPWAGHSVAVIICLERLSPGLGCPGLVPGSLTLAV
jgi:hypothetical protein